MPREYLFGAARNGICDDEEETFFCSQGMETPQSSSKQLKGGGNSPTPPG